MKKITKPNLDNDIRIDKIIRSRRKSIAAEFNEDASLVIRAPYWVSGSFIEKFLKERRPWILRNHSIALQRYLKAPRHQFKDGEEFLYLGSFYKLRTGKDFTKRFEFKEEFLLSSYYVNQAKDLFSAWYKAKAREVISERAAYYSGLTGIRHQEIRIGSASKQWGSCSSEGRLCFPWRLVMAPLHVIDSVVVHELVHVKDRSHSQGFWNEVYRYFPEYPAADRWLTDHAYLMRL